MVLLEAGALLAVGLVCGIVATTFDVLFLGAASFLSHATLLVLLIVLISSHVGSRLKAIWWSVPFTFGFEEGYFITTVASYEGFSKSMVVPLAGAALVAPLLAYAAWTAKSEKNAYGNVLSLIIMVGTLGMGYVINGHVSTYDIVMCLLVGFVLLFLPTRKLRISRAPVVQVAGAPMGVPSVQDVPVERGAARPARPTKRRARSRDERKGVREMQEAEGQAGRSSRERTRRRSREDLPPTTARRPYRRTRRIPTAEEESRPITLGNVRPARSSARN